MKKVLGIMSIVAMSALLFCSCAKSCNCTYYEDGKKVLVQSSANATGTKIFNKELCKKGNVEKHEALSRVVEGKKVTAETICK